MKHASPFTNSSRFARRMAARGFTLVVGAIVLTIWGTTPARADIVVLSDGNVLPKRLQEKVTPDKVPSDASLKQSGRDNLELRFDVVKVGREMASAALVKEIYPTIAFLNPDFINAEIAASRQDFQGAAEGFGRAAEELTGASKQVALYKRVLCYRYDNDADGALGASKTLLAAAPTTYYFAELETLRARIYMIKGRKKDAKEALERIVEAKDMNARDYFDAKLTLIDFFQMAGAGSDPAAYAKAEKAYRQLLTEITTRRNAEKDAAIQQLRAYAGVAKCLVRQGKVSDAQKIFLRIVSDKRAGGHTELLASAYRGLGDTQYSTVQRKLKSGAVSKDKIPGVVKELHEAAKSYLRVARYYGSEAGDELTPSMLNCARVWATIFTLEGENNLDLGLEAQRMFLDAHRRMPRGEERRVLTTEIKEFMAKVDVLEAKAKEKTAANAPK